MVSAAAMSRTREKKRYRFRRDERSMCATRLNRIPALALHPHMRPVRFHIRTVHFGKLWHKRWAELVARLQMKPRHARSPLIVAMGGISGLVRQNEALGTRWHV
jgi:hypothetical protein